MLQNLIKNKEIQKVVLLIILLGTAILLIKNNQSLNADNDRLASNMQSMGAELSFIKTQSGNLAAQTDVLLLRTEELKSLFPNQAKSIQNLGIKINRATQVSSTVIETQKNIITLLRDSVIHDTIRVKTFSYSDQWYQISGIAIGDSQQLQIHSTDTLTQVVFKGERIKPWLWIFSPRKLQQRVSVSNPNSIIKYSQFIQIQKQ